MAAGKIVDGGKIGIADGSRTCPRGGVDGNLLTCSSPEGKDGAVYKDYDAVAIECQGFPDAPNHSGFPSQRLNPDEEYRQTIRYMFKSKDLEK